MSSAPVCSTGAMTCGRDARGLAFAQVENSLYVAGRTARCFPIPAVDRPVARRDPRDRTYFVVVSSTGFGAVYASANGFDRGAFRPCARARRIAWPSLFSVCR